MLWPCCGHVEPMLGQERRDFCAPYQCLQERAISWVMSGPMWVLCWAYVGPCWALGPCWDHVGGPGKSTGRHRFFITAGFPAVVFFGAMLGVMLSPCSAKNGAFLFWGMTSPKRNTPFLGRVRPTLDHVGFLGFGMRGECPANNLKIGSACSGAAMG